MNNSVKLNWGMCQGEIWCDFPTLNINHKVFDTAYGVYIIWSGESTVKVGSGNIRERIINDRIDPNISVLLNLKVTWAAVNIDKEIGVKNFLADKLSPLITDNLQYPLSPQYEVNFPWW